MAGRSSSLPLVAALLLAFAASTASAFGSFGKKAASTKIPLPTLDPDTGKYTKNPLDDGEYPYDAVGAALRHGPAPFLTRVFNADEYEQGVMKYMLSAKVDRATAVGNTDAKLNNAADWAYQKMEEKRGKPVVDYTKLDPKKAQLTIAWALGIIPLTIYVINSTGSQFVNEPGPCVSKAFEGLGICGEYIGR